MAQENPYNISWLDVSCSLVFGFIVVDLFVPAFIRILGLIVS